MNPGLSLKTTDTQVIIEADISKAHMSVQDAFECAMMFLRAIERVNNPNHLPHLDQFKKFTQSGIV